MSFSPYPLEHTIDCIVIFTEEGERTTAWIGTKKQAPRRITEGLVRSMKFQPPPCCFFIEEEEINFFFVLFYSVKIWGKGAQVEKICEGLVIIKWSTLHPYLVVSRTTTNWQMCPICSLFSFIRNSLIDSISASWISISSMSQHWGGCFIREV